MNSLISEYDQITRWPKKPADKEMVTTFLGTKFICDFIYSEKEVNQIIDKFHLFQDTTLLRRELISRKILSRHNDGSEYWKVK